MLWIKALHIIFMVTIVQGGTPPCISPKSAGRERA